MPLRVVMVALDVLGWLLGRLLPLRANLGGMPASTERSAAFMLSLSLGDMKSSRMVGLVTR